jgi:hypothetical protein
MRGAERGKRIGRIVETWCEGARWLGRAEGPAHSMTLEGVSDNIVGEFFCSDRAVNEGLEQRGTPHTILVVRAGWLFDLSGSYTAIYLLDIVLLLVAGIASYTIQAWCYSLKYHTVVSG